MGLKKSITTKDEVVHADAYIRVRCVDLDYIKSRASIVMEVYHNKAARDAGTGTLGSMTLRRRVRVRGADFVTYFAINVLDTSGVNSVERAYVFLKTILEDTTDV